MIQRTNDLNQLYGRFYKALDLSRLQQILPQLLQQAQAPGTQFIASGTHFSCYRFGFAEHALAIKVPHADFLALPRLRYWLDDLENVRDFSIQLIPPIELLWHEEQFVLVTPYAEHEPSQAAAHWQPLQTVVHEATAALAARGYAIDDTIQIRCQKGVPMLIDLSDLTRIGPQR